MTPELLAFDDHRTDGRFLVHDATTQAVVAGIEVGRWTGRWFTATGASGEPLCTGRARGLFSTWWDAIDSTGQDLVNLKNSVWAFGASTVHLGSGTAELRGRAWTRDWAMTTSDGIPLLTSEPTTGFFTFRPDAWAVRVHAPMSLAEVVAVVALHRLVVKSERASVAAASS